jgi:hypothetical protein
MKKGGLLVSASRRILAFLGECLTKKRPCHADEWLRVLFMNQEMLEKILYESV